MAAAREAARRGADDALFISTDGIALEGPLGVDLAFRRSTVDHAGARHRHSRVVTQSSIFAEATRDGVETRSDLIEAARLPATDGAWFVSSGRLVAPILSLDGADLPSDPVWTQRLNGWATA